MNEKNPDSDLFPWPPEMTRPRAKGRIELERAIGAYYKHMIHEQSQVKSKPNCVLIITGWMDGWMGR